jgi:hypothetical protein
MESSTRLHFSSLASVLPVGKDAHFMPSEESVLQSHEMCTYTQWATDVTTSTPQVEHALESDVISVDISIAVSAVRNASDSISFFAEYDADRNADTRFSVEIPADMDSDPSLLIDTERAAVFHITVTGMKFRLDNGHKSVDAMTRLDLRRSRERLMSAGRMVCLLKQQLNI